MNSSKSSYFFFFYYLNFSLHFSRFFSFFSKTTTRTTKIATAHDWRDMQLVVKHYQNYYQLPKTHQKGTKIYEKTDKDLPES